MYRLLNQRSFVVQSRFLLASQYASKSNHNIPPPCPMKKQPQCPPPCHADVTPPPPTPKRPQNRWSFWGWATLGGVVGFASFAVYAKDKQELRDWLTLYAPWLDDILALIYQENKSYEELAYDCYFNLKRLVDYDGGSDGAERCPLKMPPAEDNHEVCGVTNPPVMTKDICEVESCLKLLREQGVANLSKGIEVCKKFTQEVRETLENYSPSKMKNLNELMEARKLIVEEVRDNARESAEKLDELVCYLECGVDAETSEMITTRQNLTNARDVVNTMRLEFENASDEAVMCDVHLQKVHAMIEEWMHQTKVFYPELEYDSKKPHISGDPDMLLHHANGYVKYLQEQLAEASNCMTERINQSFESLLAQDEKSKKDRDQIIATQVRKATDKLNAQLAKKLNDLKASNDKSFMETLEQRKKHFDETFEETMKNYEEELKQKLENMVTEAVEQEKGDMKKQLEEIKQKISKTEEKLKENSVIELTSRRSQQLWTAGNSLLYALKTGGEQTVNVNKQIGELQRIALTADAETDKLVQAILKAIPEKVKTDGVVSESVLRHKYDRMEDVAKKVALVEQDGGPLPVYWLSYLQSLFLFMKTNHIPNEELNLKSDQKLPKHLDTFDLLQRARYWMNDGNITNALRYIEELEGASKGVASTWLEIARQHVETRQAAEAIITYAQALAIQHV